MVLTKLAVTSPIVPNHDELSVLQKTMLTSEQSGTLMTQETLSRYILLMLLFKFFIHLNYFDK